MSMSDRWRHMSHGLAMYVHTFTCNVSSRKMFSVSALQDGGGDTFGPELRALGIGLLPAKCRDFQTIPAVKYVCAFRLNSQLERAKEMSTGYNGSE